MWHFRVACYVQTIVKLHRYSVYYGIKQRKAEGPHTGEAGAREWKVFLPKQFIKIVADQLIIWPPGIISAPVSSLFLATSLYDNDNDNNDHINDGGVLWRLVEEQLFRSVEGQAASDEEEDKWTGDQQRQVDEVKRILTRLSCCGERYCTSWHRLVVRLKFTVCDRISSNDRAQTSVAFRCFPLIIHFHITHIRYIANVKNTDKWSFLLLILNNVLFCVGSSMPEYIRIVESATHEGK